MTQTNDTQRSTGAEIDPLLTQHEHDLLDTALRDSDQILAASLHEEEARRQRRRRARFLFLLLGGVAMSLIMFAFFSGWLAVEEPAVNTASSDKPVVAAELTPEKIRQARVLSAKGWSYWKRQRFDQAIESFSQSVKLNPTLTNAWNGLGWSQFNSGQADEAIQSFGKCLERQKDHAAALNGLGQIYFARAEYDKAQEYLEKAAPDAPAAWWGLAKLHLLQGNYPEAKKWTSKIVRNNPQDRDAKRMLAAAKAKNLEDELRRLIEPAGKSRAASGDQKVSALDGWRLFQQGRNNEAQKIFRQVLKANPQDLPAINGLGWALLNSGHSRDAQPQFEKCIELRKGHPGATNGLALCLKAEGKTDEAIKLWESMQKQNPRAEANPGNQEFQSDLNKARQALKGQQE